MAPRTLPGLGLSGFWGLGEDGWKTGMDANLLKLSAVVQGKVLDVVETLPGTPNEGDIYVVTTGAQANDVAVYDNAAWVYLTPAAGWRVYNAASSSYWKFDGSAWAEDAGGGGGASAFTGLTDTPGSYSGLGGEAVRVKNTEDGLDTFALGSHAGLTQVVFQESYTAASEADIDLPDSGYAMFLVLFNFTVSNDGVDFHAWVTNDGFATVEDGAAAYHFLDARIYGTGSDNAGGGTDTKMLISNNIGNDTGEGIRGRIDVMWPCEAGINTVFDTRHSRINNGGTNSHGYGGGEYLTAEAINGLRLAPSSGTFTGTVLVIGMKDAAGVAINTQTGTSYTFGLSDIGGRVSMDNASPNSATVPANSSVAFPIGTVIEVDQAGTGTTSIAAAAGVTINSRGSFLDISAQYGVAKLLKTGTDEWSLSGDLA